MIIKECCVDANVFISGLSKEPSYQTCCMFLEKLDEMETFLFEPALVVFEVISALHRKISCGTLTEDDMEKAHTLFFQLPLLLEWKSGMLKDTRIIGRKLKLKNLYDSSYIAVASQREIPLITLDQELIQKGKPIYKSIFTPKEALALIAA